LWRRGNIVALGAKHDDWCLDVTEIERGPVLGDDLGRGELVADEQFVDDGLDLAGIEQDMAAPPLLEL
jgi:hypothetical protein